MSLLTNEAISGYREYTKRILSYARYKIGNTYLSRSRSRAPGSLR